ncbi:MAG: DNA cytosine methyltransferase [Planctomycetes bacterium]|nr:DNA cytosine methyltransferase [Planctomycetota bacterium]
MAASLPFRFVPRCVDLFCGAGGLSLGLKLAGFELLSAVDNSKAAVQTYRENFGQHCREESISEETDLPDADVIAGGPPCQGFSSAGLRRQGDQRNTLVTCFARIVARRRPLAFVFENVEGFLTSEDGAYVMDLLSPLVETGYRIHLRKVNAANFGVPQHRKRVLAIGGLGWDPGFPEPTHSAYGAPGARLAGNGYPRTPTLEESLAGLPEPSTEEPGTPPGHFFRPLVGVDLERAKALKPGQRMRDLPEGLWHDSYRRRAYRRVMDGTPTERRGGPPSGVRRLEPDQPCKAITGGALSEFLHPTEHRNLTLRECARVQTFPDDFLFSGTVSEQALLIGNAVPVLLAKVIGETLLKDLENAVAQAGNGQLLSFVPTLSNGKSPALERVTQRVRATFLKKQTPKETLLWD